MATTLGVRGENEQPMEASLSPLLPSHNRRPRHSSLGPCTVIPVLLIGPADPLSTLLWALGCWPAQTHALRSIPREGPTRDVWVQVEQGEGTDPPGSPFQLHGCPGGHSSCPSLGPQGQVRLGSGQLSCSSPGGKVPQRC